MRHAVVLLTTPKDRPEILLSQGKRKHPRRLNPGECARLMGFPDTFQSRVVDAIFFDVGALARSPGEQS